MNLFLLFMTHNSHNRLYSENQSFWKARIEMLPPTKAHRRKHIPRYDEAQLMSLFDKTWMEVAGHCRWGNCAGKMKNIFRVGNTNMDTFIKVRVGCLLLLALSLLFSSALCLSLTQWHFLQGHGWLVENYCHETTSGSRPQQPPLWLTFTPSLFACFLVQEGKLSLFATQ